MDHIRERYGDRSIMRASGFEAKSISRWNPFNGEPPPLLANRRRWDLDDRFKMKDNRFFATIPSTLDTTALATVVLKAASRFDCLEHFSDCLIYKWSIIDICYPLFSLDLRQSIFTRITSQIGVRIRAVARRKLFGCTDRCRVYKLKPRLIHQLQPLPLVSCQIIFRRSITRVGQIPRLLFIIGLNEISFKDITTASVG